MVSVKMNSDVEKVMFHCLLFHHLPRKDCFLLEIYFYLILLSICLLNYAALSLRELLNLFLNLLVSAFCNLKYSVTKDDACSSLMLADIEIMSYALFNYPSPDVSQLRMRMKAKSFL